MVLKLPITNTSYKFTKSELSYRQCERERKREREIEEEGRIKRKREGEKDEEREKSTVNKVCRVPNHKNHNHNP